jgi:hypothetical protein
MYAFRSNTERLLVFQSAGNLVPIGIPVESGRNAPSGTGCVSHKFLREKWCLIDTPLSDKDHNKSMKKPVRMRLQ